MADTEHFGVFDIIGTKKYYYYEASGKDDVLYKKETLLHPVLISPKRDSENRNKADYLVSENDFSLEDIIVHNDGKDVLCADNSYPLEFMLLGLDRPLYNKGKRWFGVEKSSFTSLSEKELSTPSECYQKLENWFRYQKALLNSVNNDKTKEPHIPNHYVIPVPDNVSYEYLEKLRAAVHEGSRCTLLWRSVAAALGAENYISRWNLKSGDIITVIDRTSVDYRAINLQLHEENGRLIPGHRLYKTSDSKKSRNFDWYPKERKETSHNRLSFLNYDLGIDGFLEYRVPDPEYDANINLSRFSESKLIIVTGKGLRVPSDPRVVLDLEGRLVPLGAGRFANRMYHNITAYYDECESLSMVVQVPNEEDLILKELIKGTTKLSGGLVVKGEPVYGISYDVTKKALKFYLRLGEPLPKAPLKVLLQQMDLNIDDEDVPAMIPLCLTPSLISGQGRARVFVEAANPEHRHLFSGVELNWSFMKDAKEPDGTPTTLNILKFQIPRSYPVNVPPPKANARKLHKAARDMRGYFRGHKALSQIELNRPNYPFRNDDTSIDKFQKVNVMGVDWVEVCDSDDKPTIEKFCDELNEIIMADTDNISKDDVDDYSAALRLVGWTYDRSDRFDSLVRKTLVEADYASRHNKSFPVQRSTICANLVSDDKLLVAFFKSFQQRLEISLNSLMYRLRSMSLIMIYNIDFLNSEKITPSDMNYCVSRLHEYYWTEADGRERKQASAVKLLIFFLKYRRVYSNFAKADSPNISDVETYHKLKDIVNNIGYAKNSTVRKHIIMLGDFLESKGKLEVPDMESDNDSRD